MPALVEIEVRTLPLARATRRSGLATVSISMEALRVPSLTVTVEVPPPEGAVNSPLSVMLPLLALQEAPLLVEMGM